MKRIAVTGGIGSGKSYVCHLLEQRGISIYDCDAAAKRLMRTSSVLRHQLTSLIGPNAYVRAQGNKVMGEDDTFDVYKLNKAAVAQFLLASEENAKAIDDIVHPAVAEDFLLSGLSWLESAILFQSGFDQRVHFDNVVVVTAPEEVRIQRIVRRDGISRDKAQEWIARQWPQEEIVRRADYEIVNDGIRPLEQQLDRMLNSLEITHLNNEQ